MVSELSFSIKSSTSDRELVFLNPKRECFVVELRGTALEASRSVYAYTDATGLLQFFCTLATYERPWNKPERWEALEGEFSVEATCSPLGQVTFFIRLRDMFGQDEEWEASARLVTELGQLPTIASNAKLFFNSVASTSQETRA
ncbi:MAG: DUF6228 family protein [Rhodanobacter sp.]|jgi:hypothetical protein|nr:DUF6228 family protein [Rhodanobacter sp.]